MGRQDRLSAVTAPLLLSLALAAGGCAETFDNSLPQAAIDSLQKIDTPNDYSACWPYRTWATPPPDEASGPDMVSWWDAFAQYPEMPELTPVPVPFRPSETTQWKMLDALLEQPEQLPRFFRLLPDTPAAHDRIKAVYDHQRAIVDAWKKAPWRPIWIEMRTEPLALIHDWLMTHSRYFRDELVRRAGTFGPPGSQELWDEKQAAEGLARLDPRAWRATLIPAATRGEPEAAAKLLEHSLAPEGADLAAMRPALRKTLLAVVKDAAAHPGTRELALRALAKDTWPGQEEWLETIVADPTLHRADAGHTRYEPITAILCEPRWVEFLGRLANSQKPEAIRKAACECLEKSLESASWPSGGIPEATVKFLLPRLNDPQWGQEDFPPMRPRFIAALAHSKLPESEAALKSLLESKGSDRIDAALALAERNNSPEALALLAAELPRICESQGGNDVVQVLLARGKISLERQLDALETCPAERPIPSPGFMNPRIDDPATFEATLARVLRDERKPHPALIQAAAERAARRLADAGDIPAGLRQAMLIWDSPAAHCLLIQWLIRCPLRPAVPASRPAEGESSYPEKPDPLAEAIGQILERAGMFRTEAPAQLRELYDLGGAKGAVGAALLADQAAAGRILRGDDRSAVLTLLAAARIARSPLPMDGLARVMDGADESLVKAAEAYLLADGSPAAVRMMRAHHHGRYLVIARRGSAMEACDDAGEEPVSLLLNPQPKGPMQDLVKEMRRKNDGGFLLDVETRPADDETAAPDEIWTLEIGGDGPMEGGVIIRRWGNRARVTCLHPEPNPTQMRPASQPVSQPAEPPVPDFPADPVERKYLSSTRLLTAAELKAFQGFLHAANADELPDLVLGVDGRSFQYTHLTPRGGRTVCAQNVDQAPLSVYDRLVHEFLKLAPPPAPTTRPAPGAGAAGLGAGM